MAIATSKHIYLHILTGQCYRSRIGRTYFSPGSNEGAVTETLYSFQPTKRHPTLSLFSWCSRSLNTCISSFIEILLLWGVPRLSCHPAITPSALSSLLFPQAERKAETACVYVHVYTCMYVNTKCFYPLIDGENRV